MAVTLPVHLGISPMTCQLGAKDAITVNNPAKCRGDQSKPVGPGLVRLCRAWPDRVIAAQAGGGPNRTQVRRFRAA